MEAKKLRIENIILNHLYKTCWNFKQARELYNIIKNDIDKYNMISSNIIQGDEILTVQAAFKKGYNIKPMFAGFKIIKGIVIIEKTKEKDFIYTVKQGNNTYTLTEIKEKNIYKYICLRKQWKNEEIRKFFVNKKMGKIKDE